MSEVRVPEGHRIHVTRAWPTPRVFERPGGWVAQLGASSDAVESELEAIIAEVDALVGGPRPRIVVANGSVGIEALFAPADPDVIAVEGLLLWVIDADAIGTTPALCGRFVDQLRKHAIAQTVFVTDASSPRARAVIAAIQSLDIGVRELEEPEFPVLVEIDRPDGVVLSTLCGAPVPRMPLAGLPGGMLPSVARAPRLRSLLLASTDASRTALYAELRAREIPLVLLAHPEGIRLRTWDDGFQALPVYADRTSLRASARTLGMAPDAYSIAEMMPRDLFRLADDRRWAVALEVTDDAGEPRYIAIQPNDVRMLGTE